MNPVLRRESRKEPRRTAQGDVVIRLSVPNALEIRGSLVNISASGFRVAHGYRALEAGQTVEFTHVEASGHARVVWNRVFGERVETGFLVLPI